MRVMFSTTTGVFILTDMRNRLRAGRTENKQKFGTQNLLVNELGSKKKLSYHSVIVTPNIHLLLKWSLSVATFHTADY